MSDDQISKMACMGDHLHADKPAARECVTCTANGYLGECPHANAPREWYVKVGDIHISGSQMGPEMVHVIEKSYADQLTQELTAVKAERDVLKEAYKILDERFVSNEQHDAIKLTAGKLQREVEVLRLYGNKDCTAMADEALKE